MLISGLFINSQAQTITTGAVSPAAVCEGSAISVAYTTTGSVTGFTFKVQIAPTATPTAFTDLPTTGSASPLTATVSNGTAAGTYRVRVTGTSSTTTITGSPSSTTLTVNDVPAPPAVSNPPPYCQNTTAAPLSATASAGNTLQWYGTSATGGTASTTAPTPPTSTPGTTKYYVSQKNNSSGCESPRAEITVTITQTPPLPGVTTPVNLCQGDASSPLSATPTTGGTLNWYGTSASGGTASATAPTPPTSATGTTTYYVSQTAGSCESARAAITVTVSAKPAPPTVANPAPYCEGVTAPALSATASAGGTLRWYGTNATGGTPTSVAPTPSTSAAGTTTYYVSQVVNGCESDRVGITVTVNARPSAPAATTPVTYCQNETAAPLSATASTGNELRWYGTSQLGGVASATAPTPPTTTSGTTTFYVAQRNTGTGCESNRASILVTVNATPGAPGVNNQSACQNSDPVTLTASGQNLKWYTTATGGTGSSTAPTLPTTTTGTTTYYVSQTVNGCEGPRAQIDFTVRPVPAAPAVASTAVVYCQNATSTPLSATASSGGTLNWYGTSATGGTRSSTAPTPSTGTAGDFTYYVSQTVNGCEGPRAGIPVTVNPTPGAPAVTTPVNLCQNGPTQPLSATASGSNTLRWYTVSTGGTASTTAPTPPTTSTGTFNYYVSQVNAANCESPRAVISAVVNALPAAPTNVTNAEVCQLSGNITLTASGQNLKWYTTATGGTASTTAPSQSTDQAGTFNYYVSQTINGCEGPRATATVRVKPQPAAPAATTTAVVYCQNVTTAVPLSATPTTGGTLNWYGTSATGGTRSGTAPTPATGTAGDFTYYVSQTLEGCESPRVGIPVTINPAPAVPGVQSPVNLCQGTPAQPLTATTSSGGTLRWYGTSATGGTASTTAPVPPTTAAGTSVYYVSQVSSQGCEGNRAAITVVVNALPTAPTGTTNAIVCQFEKPVVLTATGENLKWYTQESGGTAQTTTPSQSTDQAGTFDYYVSQTQRGCEGPRAKATVLVKPQPGLPGVQDRRVCQFDASTPVTATGENLKWYNTDGNIYPSAPTPSTTQGATFTYQVTQTVNGCESRKATLQVIVQTTPPPGVTSPVTYCVDAQATPLSATGSRLEWTDPFGRTSATAPTPPTQQPTNDQNIFYYVTQTGDNGCKSPRSEIKLVVNPRPTASITGSTTVNLGRPATLTLNYTSVPPFTVTLSDGRTKTSQTLQDTIVVLPRQTTIYQIANIENVCGKGLPGNPATATVNVLIPTITTGALTEARLCAGSQITVPFTTTGTFNTGNTFRVQMADTTTKQFIDISPSIQGGGPIQATIPLSTVQGLYFIRVIASNPAIPVPGSNSQTVLNVRQLPTATLTGSRDVFEGESAQLNIAFRGDGPWTFTYADSLRSFEVTTNANPHLVTVTPARTTTYRLTGVTNGCGTGSVSGTVTIRVLPVLGVEPTDPLLDAVRVYPVPTEQNVTVELDGLPGNEPVGLTLSNLSGQTVWQQTTRQTRTQFDLSQQPAGLYFLRVQIGERSTIRRIIRR